LDSNLLAELEAALRASNAPILENFWPGIPENETIEAVVNGRPLPDELQRLWRWHDGTYPRNFNREDAAAFGGMMAFMPLRETERFYKRAPSSNPDFFPVFSRTGAVIYADCGVALDDPCPIVMEPAGLAPDGTARDAAVVSSLGCLIELWIEALDRGFWKFDQDGYAVEGNRWPNLSKSLLPYLDEPGRIIPSEYRD